MASVYKRETQGRPNWYARIKQLDGKWQATPTGQPTKEAAKRWAIAKQAEIENAKVGILPQRAQSPDITVRQLIERYLAECHSPKVRKLAQNRTQRRSDLNQRIIPYGLAGLSTQKVRAVDIERWRDALRKDGYAHTSINATLTRLSTCFAWGIRQEIITGRNPCEGVERFPTKPRQDCYTLDEVHRLLALPDLLPMIPMALYTGMRRGELLGLRWDDIDFQAGRIDVRRSYGDTTKSDRSRAIPLHRELAPILRAWREHCPQTEEGVVFPLVVGGVARMATRSPESTTKELRAQLARAGIRDDFACPVHAMRHTFASLFMDQVDSHSTLERILGHSTAGNKVTAGYVHTDIKTLARKLDHMTLKPTPDAQIIPISAPRPNPPDAATDTTGTLPGRCRDATQTPSPSHITEEKAPPRNARDARDAVFPLLSHTPQPAQPSRPLNLPAHATCQPAQPSSPLSASLLHICYSEVTEASLSRR